MSQRLNQEANSFDLIDDVTQTLRFRGNIFFQAELPSPWGFVFPELSYPRFHMAVRGNFVIGMCNDTRVTKVNEKDIVMITRGAKHWIADVEGRKLISSEQADSFCELHQQKILNGEISNKIICGVVKFSHPNVHPLMDMLPNILHCPQNKSNSYLWDTVSIINSELIRVNQNSNGIVDRLTEALFLQILQSHFAIESGATNKMTSTVDRRILRALNMIHAEPEQDWTIEGLGNQIGMSRATLSRRFQEYIGMPPITYINKWRMMKAFDLVKNSDNSIDEIARKVGFRSSRTLSRAFKKHYGSTPKKVRLSRKLEFHNS